MAAKTPAPRARLVLASESPRRRSLLASLGLEFEVIPSDFDEESVRIDDPRELARRLAAGKAAAVGSLHPDALVIGADTVVVLGDDILGKPADDEDAQRMLRRLSGERHRVMTGVSLLHEESHRSVSFCEVTTVCFGELSEELIQRYVATGECRDKAGAYGIQELGATLVREVHGCYFNVVGLPLFRLARALREFGFVIP